MLSESEVYREWRNMFKAGNVTSESLDEAEILIDQLPPTSPLRTHFGRELDELREKSLGRREKRVKRRV